MEIEKMPVMPGMVIEDADFRKFALRMLDILGCIPVFGEMNEILEQIIIECMMKAKIEGKAEVLLLINSYGGFNKSFSAIKALMIQNGTKFTGLVMGVASSNAFNLLQQCHKRIAVADAYLMFHWGNQKLGNNELAAVIAGEKWPIENVIMSEIITANSVSERTGLPVDELKEFALYERRFYAQVAKDMNMLDEVIPNLPDKVRKAIESEES